jgi:hypothetical protein
LADAHTGNRDRTPLSPGIAEAPMPEAAATRPTATTVIPKQLVGEGGLPRAKRHLALSATVGGELSAIPGSITENDAVVSIVPADTLPRA